jgi:hypothetical protein
MNTAPASSLSPVQQKVLTLLAAGVPLSHAAEQAGVSRQTIYNWQNSTPSLRPVPRGRPVRIHRHPQRQAPAAVFRQSPRRPPADPRRPQSPRRRQAPRRPRRPQAPRLALRPRLEPPRLPQPQRPAPPGRARLPPGLRKTLPFDKIGHEFAPTRQPEPLPLHHPPHPPQTPQQRPLSLRLR